MSLRDAVAKHYSTKFGEPAEVRPYSSGDADIAISKWDVSPSTGGTSLYCTNGCSVFRDDEGKSVEILVGLLPECDEVYNSLADMAGTIVLGQSVQHGGTWNMGGPLWKGTQLSFFMTLHQHTTLDPLDEGDTHVEFYNGILLFEYEAELKREKGLDALKQHWREGRVRFWDPRRLPAG
ncbi:suppressor of fused domain protein [Nucisporomicrobium flavum]|uniref:suppressor of fused domain protein n=1 Tax=Nucisporomicrobium flavum TaxID=2785915 RepID=UPI0018F30D04|nr:suppressor of fused domain protein [Nucisporomicrobium flavum]